MEIHIEFQISIIIRYTRLRSSNIILIRNSTYFPSKINNSTIT